MKKRLIQLLSSIAMVAAGVLLPGCGQKGPLYLPSTQWQPQSPAPTPAPTQANAASLTLLRP